MKDKEQGQVNSKIVEYKAKSVTSGINQIYKIDYNNTFS